MAIKKITRDTLISDLEISVRLHHCLINDWDDPRNPIKRPATVGDYIDVSGHELLRIPNFGRKSLIEWRLIVWAVENPDSPVIEENIAEYEALKEIRATINRIAATHNSLATYYKKLADVITPLI
jgi:hypothetical protein